MAASTRSRTFLNLTMPSGPGDKPQQPVGSGFPASNLYSNKSIWTPSFAHSRDRSIVAKDSDENATGSSALNANSEADVWSSNPWNPENPSRSVTNSPGLTRDGGIPNGSAFYDHHHHAAIGMKKSGFAVSNFQSDPEGYGQAYASQKRSAQEAAYMDSIGAFAPSRDASLPPSRHSQGSPAYAEFYQASHTPSNSIHSQRQIPNHSIPFSTQAANQRAFNINKQVDDELSIRIARQMSLGSVSNGQSFNPASQPFQFNPGSQPWMGESGPSRFGNGLDFNTDPLAAQMSAMKRPSIDRISPAPTYRLEAGNSSPRSYAPAPEDWMTRPSSRDPRAVDHDRRASAHPFSPNYPQFYSTQYPYNIPPQYSPPFADPYAQNFRHPMLPAYALPPVHPGYPLGGALSPVRSSRDQDPGKSMRSELLEEFRQSTKSSKRFELKDIYKHVVEFSGDQHGSRFIQQKLETANSDEKEQVFNEIEPNAIQLMKDVFGNYVVQKFFEHGNQIQKKILAEKMKGKVVDLSVQVYACRVVQKALEHVLVEQQAELTKELEPEILRVIKDQNGNHVVQKIIELVPRQYIDFIMGALRGQVTPLASHTYGCRVIQRMLEHGTEADKAEIMAELHASAQILITDQYGNYVAQHVIQNGKPEDRESIIQLVLAQLLTLSKHKFASNVVEKCIEYGTTEQRTTIREQFTTAGSDGANPLQQMMRDQYGNYVIQKLLGQLQGAERETLVEDIKPHVFALKRTGTGASRQLQALEKLLGMGAVNGAAKNDHTSAQSDTNSVTETPELTNEPNSPESSSPPSARVSTVVIPSDGMEKVLATDRVTLQIQGED